jgi:hypothetical protein
MAIFYVTDKIVFRHFPLKARLKEQGEMDFASYG